MRNRNGRLQHNNWAKISPKKSWESASWPDFTTLWFSIGADCGESRFFDIPPTLFVSNRVGEHMGIVVDAIHGDVQPRKCKNGTGWSCRKKKRIARLIWSFLLVVVLDKHITFPCLATAPKHSAIRHVLSQQSRLWRRRLIFSYASGSAGTISNNCKWKCEWSLLSPHTRCRNLLTRASHLGQLSMTPLSAMSYRLVAHWCLSELTSGTTIIVPSHDD